MHDSKFKIFLAALAYLHYDLLNSCLYCHFFGLLRSHLIISSSYMPSDHKPIHSAFVSVCMHEFKGELPFLLH